MSNAADLVVRLQTDNTRLKSGLNQAHSLVGNFSSSASKSLLAIGGTLAAGLGAKALISSFAGIADEIDNMAKSAQRMGVSVGEFQFLQYAADLSGASVESLSSGLSFMLANVNKAEAGTGEAAKALKELGLSATFLKTLAPERQFSAIAGALGKVANQNELIDFGKSIFGKGFVQLLPLIKSNIGDIRTEFDSLGVTITDSQGKAVESFNDTNASLKTVFKGFKLQFVAEVAPALEQVVLGIRNTITEFGGMKLVALESAQGFVSFAQNIVSAFSVVLDTIKVVRESLEVLGTVGERIGEKTFGAVQSVKGFFGQEDKSLLGVTRGSTGPVGSATAQTDTRMAASVDKVRDSVDKFGQGSLLLNSISQKLETSIASLNSTVSKEANKLSSKGGFGSITNEATGKTITYGTQPQATQKVEVEVKNGNIVAQIVASPEAKALIRQQAQEYMNNAARGTAN